LRERAAALRYLFISSGIIFTAFSWRGPGLERFIAFCLLYLLNAQLRIIMLRGKSFLFSLFIDLAAVVFLWQGFGGYVNLLLYATLIDAVYWLESERYPVAVFICLLQGYLLRDMPGNVIILNLLLYVVTLLTAGRLQQMGQAIKAGESLYDDVRRYSYELEDARKRLLDYARQVEGVAQLEERSRLSGEIHDTIGHQLTGILMQVEATLRVLKIDPAQGQAMLESVRDNLSECIDILRRTVHRLKPEATRSSPQSLQVMAEDFARRTGVKVEFNTVGRPYRLPPSTESVFFANAREALTNAVRHGQARNILIVLEYGAAAAVLTVTDDGTGSAKFEKGLGLRGMEERTALAGGELLVDGTGGFTVKTVIPHREESAVRSEE